MRRVSQILMLLLASCPAFAAPQADLWDRWTAHDPVSRAVVDHSLWDRFLKAHVRVSDDGIARVAYGRIAAADKQALQSYLRQLAATPVSGLNRAQQRAYWINLYNAATVVITPKKTGT